MKAKMILLASALAAGLGLSPIVKGTSIEESGITKDAIGATDLYHIHCGVGTDHLSLKIRDNTLSVPGPLPLLNIHLLKGNKKVGFVNNDAFAIAPREEAELELAAGKGSYKISIDNEGSELATPARQTFTVQYQCLNDADELTSPAKVRQKTNRLKNDRVRVFKFSAGCGKSRTTGETAKLKVRFINTTYDPTEVALNAQIFKGGAAVNTTDINGDTLFGNEVSLQKGEGTYSLLVDHTAYTPSQLTQRSYDFSYICRDGLGNDLNGATGAATLINQIPIN